MHNALYQFKFKGDNPKLESARCQMSLSLWLHSNPLCWLLTDLRRGIWHRCQSSTLTHTWLMLFTLRTVFFTFTITMPIEQKSSDHMRMWEAIMGFSVQIPSWKFWNFHSKHMYMYRSLPEQSAGQSWVRKMLTQIPLLLQTSYYANFKLLPNMQLRLKIASRKYGISGTIMW
jgi:hypothetical protein